MPDDDLPITASTRVGPLLDRYPQLEEVLIAVAPPFKKLRNPILRKSVAKVVSLRQAAAVGRVPIGDLVNRLRAAVGQDPIATEAGGDADSYFPSRPDWFDPTRIVASIDERRDTDEDKMPLGRVLQKAAVLQPDEIVELITSHLPAPGIDIMKDKGFLVWSEQESPDLIRTYVAKGEHHAGRPS